VVATIAALIYSGYRAYKTVRSGVESFGETRKQIEAGEVTGVDVLDELHKNRMQIVKDLATSKFERAYGALGRGLAGAWSLVSGGPVTEELPSLANKQAAATGGGTANGQATIKLELGEGLVARDIAIDPAVRDQIQLQISQALQEVVGY